MFFSVVLHDKHFETDEQDSRVVDELINHFISQSIDHFIFSTSFSGKNEFDIAFFSSKRDSA